jgi:hypothetical protein
LRLASAGVKRCQHTCVMRMWQWRAGGAQASRAVRVAPHLDSTSA